MYFKKETTQFIIQQYVETDDSTIHLLLYVMKYVICTN